MTVWLDQRKAALPAALRLIHLGKVQSANIFSHLIRFPLPLLWFHCVWSTSILRFVRFDDDYVRIWSEPEGGFTCRYDAPTDDAASTASWNCHAQWKFYNFD
jgi:hypothetical protein